MLKANSRNMPIGEIKIYSSFAESEPARKKVEARKAFYNVTGRFDKAVLINGNNYLFDGYSSYIAAQEMGMDRLSVLQVVNGKKKKPVVDKQEIAPKYKSGDKVRIIANTCYHDYPMGKILTLAEQTIRCGDPAWLVEGRVAYVREADIEPYTEPKQEPVKLYCAKSLEDWLTVGKVYESIDGWITVDNGSKYVDEFMIRGGFLFPLVKRPAKVGEWVLIESNLGNECYKSGDVCEVISINDGEVDLSDGAYIKTVSGKTHQCNRGIGTAFLYNDECLVLDGYRPEPEYYNGKVVCVESSDDSFTVGKVYNWTDGVAKDNDGTLRPYNKKITSLDDSYMEHWSYKFIPFKGE